MLEIKPIGVIHSPFNDLKNMPIQPNGAKGIFSIIEIYESYIEGLSDLKGFSHIYLVYVLHKSKKEKLRVVPFMDNIERGIFSTRSPMRPNHIGLSIVKLIDINNNLLKVEAADVLDGTPLLDIKPYFKHVDCISDATTGWLKLSKDEIEKQRSDGRFVD